MTTPTPELSREGRSQYLDVVKLLLTILVVGVHAAITYGAAGSWFFDDPVGNFPTSAALTFFNIYCQSFFMGLFFFISGLFTPRSIERKGPARFVLDRLVRLGIPLVVFFFIINPLTEYAGYHADHPSFGLGLYLLMSFRGLRGMGTGPLWFVQALLGFSILAALVAAIFPVIACRASQAAAPRPLRPARTYLALLSMGLGVGVISFIVRQRFPLMTAVSNLQLGFFTQYIVYFVLGMAAGRRGFLERLTELSPRPWYWSSLGCVLLLPVLLMVGGAFDNGLDAYTTGLRWQALAYALWEQATAVVFSMALLLFARRRLNSLGPVLRVASRNAYVVYVFHAPVIVWIAYAWLRLQLPPAVKWVMLAVAGVTATVLLGELVLKRIPGVRRVMA
jgi:fucose 4-O-acetylase-like acetyltransferase